MLNLKYKKNSIFLFAFLFLCMTNFFQIFDLHLQYYWFLSFSIIAFTFVYLCINPFLKLGLDLIVLIGLNLFIMTYALFKGGLSFEALYEIYTILIVPLFGYFLGLRLNLRSFISIFYYCLLIVLLLNFIYLLVSVDSIRGFSGFLPSTNRLGAMSSLCSLLFFFIYHFTKEKKFIFISILSFATLIFSAHRAGILALFISFTIFLIQVKKYQNLLIIIKKYLLSFLIFSIILLIFIPESNVFKKTFRSGEVDILQVHDSGRSEVWSMIGDNIRNDYDNSKYAQLLLGNGLVLSKLDGWHGEWQQDHFEVPHNEYLRLFLEIGFLGLFVFLYLIYRIMVPLSKLQKVNSGVRFVNLGIPLLFHYLIIFGFTNLLYHSYSYNLLLFIFIGALKKNAFKV